MKMKKYLIIQFLIIISTLNICQDVNQLLKNVQAKFNSISNFSSDFLQFTKLSGSDKPVTYKGRFYFEKENKYRIELKNSKIISDGKTIWNYNKNTKKVVINNIESDPSAFSIKNIIYDYPAQSTVRFLGKENSYNVIELKPKKSTDNFELIKLWIDENNLIKKVEMTDSNNLLLTFELSNIKLNQNLKVDNFTFVPPQGVEVIDLR
jgi:outer membrane lipoprotein carrier protein